MFFGAIKGTSDSGSINECMYLSLLATCKIEVLEYILILQTAAALRCTSNSTFGVDTHVIRMVWAREPGQV